MSPRLNDRDRSRIRIFPVNGIVKKVMRVRTDDEIDSAHFFDEVFIFSMTQMRKEKHVVRLSFQLGNELGADFFRRINSPFVHAPAVNKVAGREADNPDSGTGACEDGMTLDVTREVLGGRGDHDICPQIAGMGLDHPENAVELTRSDQPIVVSDRYGVVTHRIHEP